MISMGGIRRCSHQGAVRSNQLLPPLQPGHKDAICPHSPCSFLFASEPEFHFFTGKESLFIQDELLYCKNRENS
jgi:hypothetical protein